MNRNVEIREENIFEVIDVPGGPGGPVYTLKMSKND
jgi:hypothetical protein